MMNYTLTYFRVNSLKGDILPGKTNNCRINYKLCCNKICRFNYKTCCCNNYCIYCNAGRKGSNIYMAVIALKQKAIHFRLH